MFAIAYGFDWYRRGYAYSRWGRGTWIAFHPLRADVISDVEAAPTEPVRSIDEVRWSQILGTYIDRDMLPADPLVVAEALQALRIGVHIDTRVSFTERMNVAAASQDPVRRQHLYRDAVVEVLLRAGIRPMLRTSGQHSEFIESIKQASSGTLEIVDAAPVAPLVGELLNFTFRSNIFARLEYRLRRRFRRRSLWRSFEVPGLTVSRWN